MVEHSGVALTVPFLIRVGVSAASDAEALRAKVQLADIVNSVFQEAELIFSPFCSSSELVRDINQQRTLDRIYISGTMHQVLVLCDALVRWSGGAFDPTCVAAGKWCVQFVKDRVLHGMQRRQQMPTDDDGLPQLSDEELQRMEAEMQRNAWFPNALGKQPAGGIAGDIVGAGGSRCASILAIEALRELQAARVSLLTTHCPPIGWTELVEVSPTPTIADILVWQYQGTDRRESSLFWVRKKDPRVELDICAVSKGWVVDRLLARLVDELGAFDALVDWGGDVRTVGRNPAAVDGVGSRQPWNVGLLHPDAVMSHRGKSPLLSPVWSSPSTSMSPATSGADLQQQSRTSGVEAVLAFPPDGASVCTSGDYFQWCHLVQSEDPLPHVFAAAGECRGSLVASVTLMADGVSCAMCDGLTTALFLMMGRSRGQNGVASVASMSAAALRLLKVVPRHLLRALILYTRLDDGSVALHDVLPVLQGAAETALPDDAEVFASHLPMPGQLVDPRAGVLVERPWWHRRNATLDGSALRSLSRSIPRSVCVVWIPIHLSDASVLDKPLYYAVAVSSLVQLSDNRVVFYLQKKSAACLVFQRYAASGSRERLRIGLVFPAALQNADDGASAASAVLQRYHEGAVVLGDDGVEALSVVVTATPVLQCVACGGSGANLVSFEASRADAPCGDHICVVADVDRPESTSVGGVAGVHSLLEAVHRTRVDHVLLRQGSQYIRAPIPPPRLRWHRLPRVQCVATISIGSGLTGAVRLAMATILLGVDVMSRDPLIVSAAARPGPLNSLLFGPAALRDGEVRVARLHFFSGSSRDGDALLDWFRDVTVTDPQQQFVYHPPLPRKMRAPNGRWVQGEYSFPGSSATMDAALIESFPCDDVQGAAGGFVLLMSPTLCSVSSIPFLASVSFT